MIYANTNTGIFCKVLEENDEAFYRSVEVETPENSEALSKSERKLRTITIEYNKALEANKRLPDRIKEASKKLYSLQTQLLGAINAAANAKYGKAWDKARAATKKDMVDLCAYQCACTLRTTPESMTGLGHVDVVEMAHQIVDSPDFRDALVDKYNKLNSDLNVDSL